MTAGADGTTIDGMGNERIERIIVSIKDQSYQPKPAQRNILLRKTVIKSVLWVFSRAMINSVQEVVKMILESIYEPVFQKTSHGFRPNRSCQTALITDTEHLYWYELVCGRAIYTLALTVSTTMIIDLLKKRIDDETFLQLIWKFLKAGYMEQWTFNRTYSGVPQGSGVSPVLANIYLHELDKFMEKLCRET